MGDWRHRLWLGLGALAVAMAVAGFVAIVPRRGVVLPEAERLQLLRSAGLPANFPVHPYARRTAQPPQGGMSYTLTEPVPDVLAWHRQSLLRSGYEVFDADVEGQDEFLPHWLYFKGSDRMSGAILIRQSSPGLDRSPTEVKILSRGDVRLTPPTVPAGVDRR